MSPEPAAPEVQHPARHSERLSILLLADDDPGHAGNVLDHIAAFRRYSRHDVRVFNPRLSGGGAQLELAEFDVVAIHYSLVITLDAYLPHELARAIANFDGLKVQFIQDEYRWVDAITAQMRDLGIHLLFSLVPPAEVTKIYGERVPDVMVVTTLAGFVPDGLAARRVPAIRDRPIDVGYRGRAIPYWLGRLGHEKVAIAQEFVRRTSESGLRCDIAWTENDRIYGDDWISFLSSCRATLGTESGASIADYDGTVESEVRAYLSHDPGASYDQVAAAVLEPYEGNVVINVISPRVFEAAALRTALVLFPGHYSGIVRPWEHYIPLEKDFSNLDQVVERIQDDEFLEEMTEHAYRDLIASGRYTLKTFVGEFDALVERYGVAAAPADKPRFEAALEAQRRSWHVTDLKRSLRRGAERLVTWRILRRHRDVRTLRKELQASGSDNAGRLDEDVLRLALIADAHSGALATTVPFEVVPRFDDASGALTLVSRALESDPPDEDVRARRARARAALQDGSVQEIVWYHGEVGLSVPVTFAGSVVAAYPVGYYRLYGAHKFAALERALLSAGTTNAPVWDVIISDPAPRALARLKRRRLTGDHALGLLGRRPLHYGARTALTMGFAACDRRRRRFAARAIVERSLRARVGILDVLDDLAKLRKLSATNGGIIVLQRDPHAGETAPVNIRWVREGEPDHEFLALSAYARLHYEEARNLLRDAARNTAISVTEPDGP